MTTNIPLTTVRTRCQYIINLCDLYAPKFYINSNSSDYDDVNDMLMHIKSALTAVQTVDEGVTLQGGE